MTPENRHQREGRSTEVDRPHLSPARRNCTLDVALFARNDKKVRAVSRDGVAKSGVLATAENQNRPRPQTPLVLGARTRGGDSRGPS